MIAERTGVDARRDLPSGPVVHADESCPDGRRDDGWRYPKWEDAGDGQWHLTQAGRVVGEVYRREGGVIRWHCRTSDWRGSDARSIEQAKAECEVSFWKDAWETLHRTGSVRAGS